VFDGVAIYNALKRHHAAVTVWIDGIAASIASMIAMAGDEVVMPENAMLVLHDPSGLVAGTAAYMRAMAEALDRMKADGRGHRDKSGRRRRDLALMQAGTCSPPTGRGLGPDRVERQSGWPPADLSASATRRAARDPAATPQKTSRNLLVEPACAGDRTAPSGAGDPGSGAAPRPRREPHAPRPTGR
jgi:hypothetical protein